MSEFGGKRQGRYVLGDLLGRGGMAEVFAGSSMGDHGFQKPVAIKQLLPELANDDVFVERLIEEAKLLVGMQHGNIVSVLDLARDGDDVFLVMEFVDGPSLRQLLKARGTRGLPFGVVTYILQSAAQGLEFAHARGVIHADISPSNLLLTTSGEVRVADFGIARQEGLGGVVEGKWAYMAPEQARGEPLTARSDIFAFGVVLYELLTNQHPFGRQVTADERDNHEPMRVIPPRVVRPSVPQGLDNICMRCLQHEPRARYGRIQEVIDALVEERYANGYREGASDLAQTIREVNPEAAVSQPRTMITDRPVTIVTRSLLSQPKPQRQPVQVQQVQRPITDVPMPPEKSTSKVTDPRQLAAAAAPPVAPPPQAPPTPAPELPPMVRADGTPMPPFRMRPGLLMPSEGLAAAVGGATITGRAKMELPVRATHRLTFMILGMAALIGAIAAMAFELRPNSDADARMAQSGPKLTKAEAEAAAVAAFPELDGYLNPKMPGLPVVDPATADDGGPKPEAPAPSDEAKVANDDTTKKVEAKKADDDTAKSDDRKSDDRKSDDRKSDDTAKADDRKSDDTAKSDDRKSDDRKSDDRKSDDTAKSDDRKSDDRKSDDRKSDDRKSDDRKSDDTAKSDDRKSDDRKFDDTVRVDRKSDDRKADDTAKSDDRKSDDAKVDKRVDDKKVDDKKVDDKLAKSVKAVPVESKARQVRSAPVVHKSKLEPGILRVTADPWADVEVDGTHQDSTGGTRFVLQPGKHAVHLTSKHNRQTCTVTVESGKNTILRVAMNSGDCE